MNKREIKRAILLAQDTVNIVNDYCFSLDNYFKNEDNRIKYKDLYEEYQVLALNLKNATKKRGF